MKSLLRPGSKPINTAIVDQTREVTTPSPQHLPNGGHCQNDMEVVSTLSDEVLPDGFTCWWDTSFVSLVAYLNIINSKY